MTVISETDRIEPLEGGKRMLRALYKGGNTWMQQEQTQRFDSMRQLVTAAEQALTDLRGMTHGNLQEVDNDSSMQAEQLQRIQQAAGEVVQTMTELADVARHARSYQAQQHQKHSGNTPM